MIMHLRVLILIAGLLVTGLLRAQEPVYINYNVNTGLPGNIVYCATQDENGLMWFGTDKGLACFDGVRFQTYGIKDGLPDPEVLNLYADSQGRLWISCFKKKLCYRYKGKFYTEKNDSLLGKFDLITSLMDYYEEKGKGVWILNHSKVFSLYPNSGTTIKSITPHEGGNSTIWGMGMAGGQLLAVDPRFLIKIDHDSIASYININKKFVEQLMQEFGGYGLWGNHIIISSHKYTEVLEYQNDTIKTVNKLEDIGGRVSIDNNGIPWISSTQFGCIRLDQFQKQGGSYTWFLPNTKINKFFEDNLGGKWFCTSGSGVYYLPLHHAQHYNNVKGIVSNNITTINGNGKEVFFGDDEANLYVIKNGAFQKMSNLSGAGRNRVRQISFLRDYTLSASDRGVFLIRGAEKRTLESSHASKYILPVSDDEFIYGTPYRLFKYSFKSNASEIILRERTTSATLDHERTVWVGGIDGLYASSDSFRVNWGNTFPVLNSKIVALAPAGETGVWVATPADGLLLATTQNGQIKKVEIINERLSVAIQNIQSLFTDNVGRIWMATNNGVFGIDKSYKVTHLNKDNGLAENDVNAIYVSGDTLWAATVSGLSKIPISGHKPKNDFATVISFLHYKHSNVDIKLNLLDSVPGRKEVLLDPSSSMVELGLGGLDYGSHQNMRYLCLVHKKMPHWMWLTTDFLMSKLGLGVRGVTDSIINETGTLSLGVNLSPGNYLIQVFAINADGVISAKPDALILTKVPYWYQTIWTLLGILLLIGLTGWRLLRIYLQNKRLMMRISEARLQTIKLQINPHFIGNSVNAIQQFFFPPDFPKASTYIEIFTRLLRTTIDYAEKTFYTVDNEVNYLEDYLVMTRLRFGDNFNYDIIVSPDIDRRLPFPVMVLQPLVENATIHGFSPEGNSLLQISFEKKHDEIVCTILDNGPGINQTKAKNVQKRGHASKGLALTQNKISTLNELYRINARLSITDVKESSGGKSGTCVVFSYVPPAIEVKDETQVILPS